MEWVAVGLILLIAMVVVGGMQAIEAWCERSDRKYQEWRERW